MNILKKRWAILAMALMALPFSVPVFSGTPEYPGLSSSHVVLKRIIVDTSSRPRVPNGQIVECEMRDNLLVLDFAFAEGISTITITAVPEGTDYTYWFDSSALPISFAVPPSDVLQIEVHTDWGNTYEGILELE